MGPRMRDDRELRLRVPNLASRRPMFLRAWQHAETLLRLGIAVDLSVRPETRSGPQNRRYWSNGLLAQIARDAVVQGRKYSAEVWHEQFKRMFIGVIELPDGSIVGQSSTGLTVAQFSAFCDKVESYAVTELGISFHDLEY